MIPAYQISPEDLMEVVYAISQIGPNSSEEVIEEFTGHSTRRTREAVKVGIELGLIKQDSGYSVPNSYREQINEVEIEQRDIILNRSLIQYRPFRTFVTYLRKGYAEEESARKTNVIHEIANDKEYIIDYFSRFGSYAGLIEVTDEGFKLEVEPREIPVNSVDSVESLRDALESEAEIRFYIEETLSSETVNRIDEDTEDEIVKAFTDHVASPRDSITAAGRALEDYLREIGRKESNPQKYQNASGTGQIANLLKGDNIIREVQRKRALSLSSIRNKGGAHGDDQQTGDRWQTSPELALSTAIQTTLLIGSVDRMVYEGDQLL